MAKASEKQTKRKRIIALDIIRGYFMMAIIVDHVSFAPSLLYVLTGGGMLFASPAEGFFVISGLLVGYLYGPKILTRTKWVVKKVWSRAALLYVLSVGFTLLFSLWAYLVPDGRLPLQSWEGSITGFIVNTFTLRYAYGWTDFLPRYALFMLAAPAMLWLVAKGRAWLLAMLSGAVWLFLADNPYFMPFSAWQLLFTGGVIIGFYLPSIEAWFVEKSTGAKRRITTGLVGVAATSYGVGVAVFIFPALLFGTSIQISPEFTAIFSKQTLGIGRLLLGVIWFSALYLVVRRYERLIRKENKRCRRSFWQKFTVYLLPSRSCTIYNFDDLLAYK